MRQEDSFPSTDGLSDLKQRASDVLGQIENLLGNTQDDGRVEEAFKALILAALLGGENEDGVLDQALQTRLLGGEENGGLLQQAITNILLGGKEQAGILNTAANDLLMGNKEEEGVIPRLDKVSTQLTTLQQTHAEDISKLRGELALMRIDIGTLKGQVAALASELEAVRQIAASVQASDSTYRPSAYNAAQLAQSE